MDFLSSLWTVLAQMAPWLMLGFLLAGVVSVLLPAKWVSSVMGGSRGWHGALNAVLIGIPLPVCSCGVLPLAAGLRKAGAGKGAVAGFLAATPQTGVDSVLATYALMGWPFALARPIAAFLTGIVGGLAVDLSGGSDGDAPQPGSKKVCCHCHKDEKTKQERPVVFRIIHKAFVELLGEIARPLALGLVVAAVVTTMVPADFFASALGGSDWILMPVMVVVGFPMYVCSTASIPIAASLVAKGLSPGAALVFLMVGPAVNAASISTASKIIGCRATAVYVAVIAVGALLCGVAMNALPFAALPQVASCHAAGCASPIGTASAVLLSALVVFHLGKGAMSAICSRRHACCGGECAK